MEFDVLLSRYSYVTITGHNQKHFRDLGYNFGDVLYAHFPRIRVLVDHLREGCKNKVSCRCDICGKKYIQMHFRNKDVCGSCRTSERMKIQGALNGTKTRGKKRPSMTGSLHPRWKADRSEFKNYSSQVHVLTRSVYKDNKHILNPNDYPRTKAGVEGGYQLDHIVSVRKAFDMGWPPERCAELSNLQMLPWKENRRKWSG